MPAPHTPAGFSTISPFVIARDVDGLLLHAELEVGGTTVMFGGRKPGWPFASALLQIHVDDVEGTLAGPNASGPRTYIHDTLLEVLPRLGDPHV